MTGEWRARWADRPLGVKIGALLVVGAALTAAFATAAMLGLAWWSAERQARDEAVDSARALAFALQAPVAFFDEAAIREAVDVLRARPQVQGAWVRDQAGTLVYAWGLGDHAVTSATRGGLMTGWLQVSAPIVSGRGGDRLGEVALRVSLDGPMAGLRRQVYGAVAAALAGVLLALLASRPLVRRIDRPVVRLAEAASQIAREQHYTLRLKESGGDEVGVAVRAFNQMIGELQRRDEALGELTRQLQRRAEESQHARRLAEAASLAKTRFLANMSHELRSPLNGVIGAAQLLQLEGADASRRAELVEIIRTSGTHLLGLIEGVLDLSRIESGALQLAAEDFNVAECVDSAVLTAAAQAQAKGLRLECIVETSAALWRRGDPSRLRQLLLNLLGNAVKFTEQGEVSLRLRADDDHEDRLRFEVHDTGIGIDAAVIDTIFEPFQQADESTTRRFGGTGLGLAISRDLARLMGGRIEVSSQPGVGSCFTLVLPLPRCAAPPPTPEPLGLRVAWCEPNRTSAAALQHLLRRMGCVEQRCDDVASLRAFMASPDGRGRPAWLLVADDDPAGRQMLAAAPWLDPQRVVRIGAGAGAAEAGVAARVMTRPVLRAALASRLRAVAGAGTAGQAAGTGAGQNATVLLVEDDPINQSVVRSMLEHAGYRCRVAQDGHAALALLRDEAVDLVLMDWQMPEMDGLETTRRLRAGAAGPAAAQLPVLALTANAFAEDRSACLAAGMNDFLTKPVMAARLVEALQRWLRPAVPVPAERPAGPGQAATTAPAAAAPTGEPDYDPSVLLSLPMVADGSDTGVVDELLALFDDSARETLARLQQAVGQGDAAAARRAVHSLKSSAAQVGALALSAEAARQEAALRGGGAVDAEAPQRLERRLADFRRAVAAVHGG